MPIHTYFLVLYNLNFKIVTTCGIHRMGVNVGLGTLYCTVSTLTFVGFSDNHGVHGLETICERLHLQRF